MRLIPLLLIGLLACHGDPGGPAVAPRPPPPTAPPPSTPPTPEPPMEGPDVPAQYVATAKDLTTALGVAPGSYHPGDSVALTLVIHNVGTVPRRVYVLPEPFRSPFHFVWLRRASDRAQVATMPPSPPHGIVVTEAHFPEIAAGGELAVPGTFRLPPDLAPGSYELGWRMRNTLVHEWKGGVQTLDGVTQPLFGGGEIPGIWMGSIDAFAPITVAP